MNKEEILEGNKLIAEFMNRKWDLESLCGILGLYVFNSSCDEIAYEIQYHSSWDWLMPVVEKIWDIIGNRQSLFYFDPHNICLKENYILITSGKDHVSNMHDCYYTVVNFIKWYNKNVKNEDKRRMS